MENQARILSIQSHVVSGYVGNKSAVFPLQLLGFEVDFINSVQLSNHTGYKSVKGQILTQNDLTDLTVGLAENGIDNYTHLLTGYIGNPLFLQEIAQLIQRLKTINKDLVYVCDPVMGDDGKLYVPKELIPIYKEKIIPLATVITPNLFEAEILTDMKIKTLDDIWAAIEKLHDKGCQTVVISSAEDTSDIGHLRVFASTRQGTVKRATIKVQKLPINFTGSGDLFAALFLAWLHKTNNNLVDSLERAIASLQAVLKKTYASAEGKENNVRNKELKLIQSKAEIENPNIIYRANIEQ